MALKRIINNQCHSQETSRTQNWKIQKLKPECSRPKLKINSLSVFINCRQLFNSTPDRFGEWWRGSCCTAVQELLTYSSLADMYTNLRPPVSKTHLITSILQTRFHFDQLILDNMIKQRLHHFLSVVQRVLFILRHLDHLVRLWILIYHRQLN